MSFLLYSQGTEKSIFSEFFLTLFLYLSIITS